MNPTQRLHDAGQSLWLDNITRGLLNSGTLARYIETLAVTGLTSNPTIFDRAIGGSADYDATIRERAQATPQDIYLDLALPDLRRAAELLRPIHERTDGVDGWVSLEVSPLLAYDRAATLASARRLHALAGVSNAFIKIPGTRESLPAVEDAIFEGIPVNVTLLFTRDHYLAAADAYMRGIERRIRAGLDPVVASVASLFVSRWDRKVASRVGGTLQNRLGIAVAAQTYGAYCELLDSERWQRLANAGARPQRLLWASTGTKDPEASDVLYVSALAAPLTVNTMPERTLLAFADHGRIDGLLPADGGDAESVLAEFAAAGVQHDVLGDELQREGADDFVRSWTDLLDGIARKSARFAGTDRQPAT